MCVLVANGYLGNSLVVLINERFHFGNKKQPELSIRNLLYLPITHERF